MWAYATNMASAEQMAGYAAHLRAHTPTSSKQIPVTEVAIFKLQAPFAQDHAAAVEEFESQIVANTAPGKPHAKGIRKIAWGFSVEDPATFIWIIDWDRIESHWDFWLAPGFPPVIASIVKLFEPGRPLVRHYDFGGDGMLHQRLEVARVMVWDDCAVGKSQERARGLGAGVTRVAEMRGGYAVDLGEGAWWCSLLGYEAEADARADNMIKDGKGAESHIVHLKYAC